MKLIRLPSGPLACVYSVGTQQHLKQGRGKVSGVYRAYSGSVEADGVSEEQALQALDERVRRLSAPPPAEITEFELQREAANDVSQCSEPPSEATVTGQYARFRDAESSPASDASSRNR